MAIDTIGTTQLQTMITAAKTWCWYHIMFGDDQFLSQAWNYNEVSQNTNTITGANPTVKNFV